MDEVEKDMFANLIFPATHSTELLSTDVVDKPFVARRAVSSLRADAVVAKSGASAGISAGRLTRVLPA